MSLPKKPAKPIKCPWCREPPELRPLDPKKEGDAWGAVVCMNEECPTFDERAGHGVMVRDGEKVNDTRGTEAYQQIAIKRWNKARTPPPAWMFAKRGRAAG